MNEKPRQNADRSSRSINASDLVQAVEALREAQRAHRAAGDDVDRCRKALRDAEQLQLTTQRAIEGCRAELDALVSGERFNPSTGQLEPIP